MPCLSVNITVRPYGIISRLAPTAGTQPCIQRQGGLQTAILTNQGGLLSRIWYAELLESTLSTCPTIATEVSHEQGLRVSMRAAQGLATNFIIYAGLQLYIIPVKRVTVVYKANGDALNPHFGIVCFAKPFGDYLLVSPEQQVQWISEDIDLYYLVQSNVTWEVE